jgi:hypothetical protein
MARRRSAAPVRLAARARSRPEQDGDAVDEHAVLGRVVINESADLVIEFGVVLDFAQEGDTGGPGAIERTGLASASLDLTAYSLTMRASKRMPAVALMQRMRSMT